MKAAIIVIASIMATAGPVFAEQPQKTDYIIYKINIDRDGKFERELESNKQLFEQLKNNNLFSNWTKDQSQIPENAREAFKKPAFDDSVEDNKEKTDYIKCARGTTTK